MENKNHRAVKYILRRMTLETRKLDSDKNWFDIMNSLNFCKQILYLLDVCFYWDDVTRTWREVKS